MLNLKKINNILEYSFLAIAIYIILFTDYNYLLTLPLFPMFIFFKYIHWYGKKNKLDIPTYYFTLGIAAIYLTVIGEFFFEFYYKFIYYDKVLHFIVPIYLSAVAGFFFGKNIKFRKIFIVLSVMGLCALWEMFEFVIDTISGTTMMQGVVINMKELTGGFVDTMKDLSFNLIGSILVSFLPINKPRSNKNN